MAWVYRVLIVLSGLALMALVACAPAAPAPPTSAPAPTTAPAPPAQPTAPAAAPTAAPAPTTKPADRIKMAMAGTLGPASSLLSVAADQGFLAANGLDVDIRIFPSSADAVNALVAGEIVGAEPSAQIVNSLLARGADIKVLAIFSRNPRDMKVVGSKDIAKPADLRGKKVAVVSGTASEFLITRYLQSGGLSMKDVDLVKADPPEIVAVMDRGEAQAFALWEPFPSNALKVMGDRGKILAYSEDLGYKGSLYQVMAGKFLKEQPEAAVRLLKAYAEAEKFIRENPAKALEIVAKASRLDAAAARPLFEAGDYRLVADQDMVNELRLVGEWLKDIGQIKELPDYSKAIDTSYLQKVDPARVTLSGGGR